jgi:hypothetical protein
MASEVDIANLALTKLGAATIISLNDPDPKATVMNLLYPIVRDAELRRRKWKFSLRRASLPALAATPIGYARQFQLPTDPLCLRVIQVGDYHVGLDMSDYRSIPTEIFSIEGTTILANLPAPLNIRYIAQVTDTGTFDAAFVDALACRMAFESCKKITNSDSAKESLRADYRAAIREAAHANALESAPAHPADDSWVMARLGH